MFDCCSSYYRKSAGGGASSDPSSSGTGGSSAISGKHKPNASIRNGAGGSDLKHHFSGGVTNGNGNGTAVTGAAGAGAGGGDIKLKDLNGLTGSKAGTPHRASDAGMNPNGTGSGVPPPALAGTRTRNSLLAPEAGDEDDNDSDERQHKAAWAQSLLHPFPPETGTRPPGFDRFFHWLAVRGAKV